MAKKQSKQNQKRLTVTTRRVATPDSNARLSRAIVILLKAAAEADSQAEDTSNGKKETLHGQAPAEEAPTRGSDGNVPIMKDNTNPNPEDL